MGFFTILLVVLVAAGLRARALPEPGRAAVARVFLRYLLVGYCGVPMLVVAVAALVAPTATAARFGFEAGGGAYAAFLGVAYLGMSLVATLAVRYRGEYLAAAALVWIVFLGGATFVHLHELGGLHGGAGGGAVGAVGPGGVAHLVAVHGGVATLLAVALVASGLLRRPGSEA